MKLSKGAIAFSILLCASVAAVLAGIVWVAL